RGCVFTRLPDEHTIIHSRSQAQEGSGKQWEPCFRLSIRGHFSQPAFYGPHAFFFKYLFKTLPCVNYPTQKSSNRVSLSKKSGPHARNSSQYRIQRDPLCPSKTWTTPRSRLRSKKIKADDRQHLPRKSHQYFAKYPIRLHRYR